MGDQDSPRGFHNALVATAALGTELEKMVHAKILFPGAMIEVRCRTSICRIPWAVMLLGEVVRYQGLPAPSHPLILEGSGMVVFDIVRTHCPDCGAIFRQVVLALSAGDRPVIRGIVYGARNLKNHARVLQASLLAI